MIVTLRPDFVGFKTLLVWHYLLLEGDDVIAVDTGLAGGQRRIARWFQQTGRQPSQLKAILLTHGHLDHAGSAERLRDWSGAPIYLHPADRSITRGTFPYRGWSRVAGWLEALGRPLTGYRPPTIDHELQPGATLPFWGGLQVIHLPGHTPGHVGFFASQKKVLILGDLLICRAGFWYRPPIIFTADDLRLRESITQLASIDFESAYPMHHWLLRQNLREKLPPNPSH